MVGILARSDFSLNSNSFMLGSINTRSRMALETYGVWFPVPNYASRSILYRKRFNGLPTKEKCHQRVHHSVPEVIAESKHTKHGVYRNECEDDLKSLDGLEDLAKLSYVLFELASELRGEYVGPEVFSFAKAYS